ncbi:MAG: aldo/keto reductase [Candidatus Hydrogenedentes bacterium]|nr:aldo/keto reductase [Candidatus Hydrogenedentota bacterium]
MNRRSFLGTSLAGAALLGAPAWAEKREGMPYRDLGKTGEKVSLLCVGGAHIGMKDVTDEQSIAIMRAAVDEGVNFFDNAWAYHGGRSETLMGQALKDGYRDKVFLMTKGQAWNADLARKYLEESLRRLDVDMIDLWQVHEVVRPEYPAQVYTEGVLEYLLKAKEEGKIRYIGFTGHHLTSIHLEMIDRGFPFDAVQMPMSVLDYHFWSFQQKVLPLALEKNMGIIAMKTLAGGGVMQAGTASVAECLRYAMSLPVSTVVSGMQSMEELKQNLAVAKAFTPMDEAEMADLRERTKPSGEDGRFEAYKTAWHKDVQEKMIAEGLTPG